MEEIKFTKKIWLRNPWLIAAWPGMGEVAFKAVSCLIEELRAEKFAVLMPEDFFYFPGSIVHEGVLGLPELPRGEFYYWKNPHPKQDRKSPVNDLVMFISNGQPDLAKADRYCEKILSFAKMLNIKKLIAFAAMPLPIDHTQEPGVWLTATTKVLAESYKKYGWNILTEGQISGMNGLFLGMAKAKGLEGICLLGEIPLYTLQIENPFASCAVLNALSKIINIKLDFTKLIEQVHIMQGQINNLLEHLNLSSSAAPIGEEEIEKIKQTLSQLTKLPLSVKEKLEVLFNQTKIDISKASELKKELDKWNVYREYEDRFLDLFKKK